MFECVVICQGKMKVKINYYTHIKYLPPTSPFPMEQPALCFLSFFSALYFSLSKKASPSISFVFNIFYLSLCTMDNFTSAAHLQIKATSYTNETKASLYSLTPMAVEKPQKPLVPPSPLTSTDLRTAFHCNRL